MEESLRLLLVEADMYKEEMEKTWFKLVQFSQRLKLIGGDKPEALGNDILVKIKELNEIAALLEESALAVSSALTGETASEEIPEQEDLSIFDGETAEEIIAPAGESVFAPAEESVFAFAEENEPAPEKENDSAVLPHDDIIHSETEPQETPAEIPSELSFIDDEGAVYCGKCGYKLNNAAKFCSNCGDLIKFKQEASSEQEEPELSAEANEPAPAGVSVAFGNIEEEEPEDGIFEESGTVFGKASPGEYVSRVRPAAYLIRHRDNSFIPVTTEEFFIGRDPAKTDFCISDNNAISRVHMKIFYSNDRYYISDCGSVNGTYLNEKAVFPDTPEILFDGSEIRINTETFSFQVSY